MSWSEPRFAGRWAVSSFVFLLLALIFCGALPLGAGPDEPAQVIKAASTVRGQIVGRSLEDGAGPTTIVEVPETFLSIERETPCMDFHVRRGAGCIPPLQVSWNPSRATTYVGRYPPLYYLAVGVPTLLSDRGVAIYAMRIISALLSATLLGLAVAVASRWARSRLMVSAVAVAATPTAVFLAGTINPNGLEISAALVTWTSGLILWRDHAEQPPRGLVAAFAASAAVLAVTEAIAVFWLLVIVVTLVALDRKPALELLHRRSGRVAAVVVGSVAALAAVYSAVAKAYRVAAFGGPVAAGASWAHILDEVWGRTRAVVSQSVGSFGQPDTFAPRYLWLPWLLAVLVGVVVMAVLGWRRERRSVVVLVGLIVASALVPAAIMASHARVDGVVWQARDGLPIYMGVPLLIGSVLDPAVVGGRSRPRVGVIVHLALAVLVAAGMAVALLRVLRRYTVGLGRTVDPLAQVPGRWDPPVPTLLLLVASVVLPVAYALWLLALRRSTARFGQTGGPASGSE